MAKDYADKFTDKEQLNIEKRLHDVYREAMDDAKADAKHYWQGYTEIIDGKPVHHAGFLERYNVELQAKEEGKYTDAQWNAWVNSQIGRGGKLDGLAEGIAQRATDTNKLASDYINGVTPGIFAENRNFEAFTIGKDYGVNMTFLKVPENAQKRLAFGFNHTEFRTVRVNPIRDYNWNYERVQNALHVGLLKGESVDKVADRFMQVMGTNQSAAVRNARTAITSARNAGRQDAFEEASDMGIEIIKEWKAAFDNRVRDSHDEMNGVRVPWDEEFPNGLMYPGDPAGEPAEVYNCRCSMARVRPNYRTRTDNTVESYLAWKEEQKELKNGRKNNK